MVDVAVEAADGVPAEALGLAGQGAQRGVHGGVREKGLGVLHGRLAPELSVGGRRRHGDGRWWSNRGCARCFFLEASVCAVFVDAYGAQQQGGERLLLPIST